MCSGILLAAQLVSIKTDHDGIILVDAHVCKDTTNRHYAAVSPERFLLAFTHILTPCDFLVFLNVLHGKGRTEATDSMRGKRLDFERNLWALARSLMAPAARSAY